MPTRNAGEYIETLNPKGYINNREITNLDGNFLVKGSQNVRIVNREKVVSSKRYTLKGAAKVYNNPIVSAFDWKTNTNVYRNLRSFMTGQNGELEVWYNEAWERVRNNLPHVGFEWVPWWSSTENLDLLIGLNGTAKVFMWSGGIAEVASVTANTITKKGYYSGTTIAFNDNGVGVKDTITDSLNGFVTAGFTAGQIIVITGSALNNGTYTIETVTASTITLVDSNSLQTEAIGATVVIKDKNTGTWGQSRFLASEASRSVRIGDQDYTYSGGETTGTLTGVSPSPVTNGVTAGDLAVQTLMEFSPTELTAGAWDIIGIRNNQVYYGSSTSRKFYVSEAADYKDFDFASPRVPGDGFTGNLDSSPTGFIPESDAMYVSAGDDDLYAIKTILTADGVNENVSVEKLPSSPGQSARSPRCISRIKNGVIILTVEKTLDTLGNIANYSSEQSVPISDDIRDDFETYDLTDAHVKYFRRAIYVALPAEGLVLEYDMRFGYWQPPQVFPVSRLAIIDDQLCGHSSTSNETYKLYDGYNDLGAVFTARAAFGYENFGSRFSLKNFDEAPVEVYISRTTEITDRILYEFEGANGEDNFTIDESNIISGGNQLAGLGQEPLGSNPLGSTSEALDELFKVRVIHTTTRKDFFERQRIFESSSPDCRFEIIAFAENAQLSDNEPVFIRK